MKRIILLLLTLSSVHLKAQPLELGQAVFTFGSGVFGNNNSGEDWAFLVYDVRNTDLATTTVNWNVSKLHPMNADSVQWKRANLGPLMGVAIDTLGNIYLSATSIYDFGASYSSSGAAAIFKVDAASWGVSNLTTTLNQPVYNPALGSVLPNKGCGLGDLCYDQKNHQLFVSNFEDGKIYRFNTFGTILSVYDPFAPDVADSLPAGHGERVWGLAVFKDSLGDQNLYFSRVNIDDNVTDPTALNEIWSVPLDPLTGDFNGTEILEISIQRPTGMAYTQPVSDICFNSDGDIFLAEKSMWDLSPYAHESRVISYSPLISGGWSSAYRYITGQYSNTDAAGGIDLGYERNDSAQLVCEKYIWASADAVLWGPPYVYGITGIPVSGNSSVVSDPDYFLNTNIAVDHDLTTNNIPKLYMGDVEIFRKSCNNVSGPPIIPPVTDTCDFTFNPIFINVISPNGDGINDEIVFSDPCREMELIIYDRWGNKIFHEKGNNIVWKGKNHLGKIIDDSVYYAVFRSDSVNKSWFIHSYK